MAPGDPHQGGRLEDMASSGTTIPNDAGTMNTIRSVPSRDDSSSLCAGSIAQAADNPADIPRTVKDTDFSGDGTGDPLPASVQSKRLHLQPNNPTSKGHKRDEGLRNSRAGVDVMAGVGPEMDVRQGRRIWMKNNLRGSMRGKSEKYLGGQKIYSIGGALVRQKLGVRVTQLGSLSLGSKRYKLCSGCLYK